VLFVTAIYFGMRGTAGNREEAKAPLGNPTVTRTPPRPDAVPEPRAPVPTPPIVANPQSPAPTVPPVTRSAEPAGDLTITEFGVGRRMVNLRLEGESDRFAPGDRVCFATRVSGGRRGEVIRHVWIYEGRTQQSIPLRLGGPDFRTHSNKTLGHAGQWAVEARDDRGNVLAQVSFACLPPDR
jgi:hypothetical protein